MAWVTISLRKQALKGRMNYISNRLMDLSQERESMQMSAGYAQSTMSAEKSLRLMQLGEAYANGLDEANKNGSLFSGNSNSQAFSNYMAFVQNYQQAEMDINSRFQMAEESQRKLISARETAISSEQEVLQSQLAAVSAEYDALEKGLESDIKRDTIKLA